MIVDIALRSLIYRFSLQLSFFISYKICAGKIGLVICRCSHNLCFADHAPVVLLVHLLSFFKRFYLLIFREGKGGRETSMCGCLSSTPYWGPGPKPRHVPWLGIEPVTLCFAVWSSIHWATPARVAHLLLNINCLKLCPLSPGHL